MLLNVLTRSRLVACFFALNLYFPAALSQQDEVVDESIAQLAQMVKKSLDSNPEVLAAQDAARAARLALHGATLPLNNPELGMEAERTDIDTFSLSYSQTLDWHDKQQGREQVAEIEWVTALQKVEYLRLKLAEKLLDVIGTNALHHEITTLAKQRTVILGRFVQLAEQRYAAGDIALSELELARLSLADAIMQHASSGAALIQARSDFFLLSGDHLDLNIRFPDQLPATLSDSSQDEALIRGHPAYVLALKTADIGRKKVNSIDLARKADPAFSVTAGREDNESLIAVSLSFPLQLRNNFNSQVDIARAETLQADQQAQLTYRTLQSEIESARGRYQLVSNAWSLWVSGGSVSLKQHIELLETQWKSGEINTTDYLQQVEQTLDTRITAAELHGDLWRVWVEWLSASGTLNRWFKLTN